MYAVVQIEITVRLDEWEFTSTRIAEPDLVEASNGDLAIVAGVMMQSASTEVRGLVRALYPTEVRQ